MIHCEKNRLDRYPEFINLGLISTAECNALYNKCFLTMALSPTNPSRVPFEAMAAGSCVVDLDLDNKDDFDNGLLTLGKTPQELAINMYNLLRDKNRLNSISEAGISFVQSRTNELAYRDFLNIIGSIINEK